MQQKTIRRCWLLMALGVIQMAIASVLTSQGWFGMALLIYMFAAMPSTASNGGSFSVATERSTPNRPASGHPTEFCLHICRCRTHWLRQATPPIHTPQPRCRAGLYSVSQLAHGSFRTTNSQRWRQATFHRGPNCRFRQHRAPRQPTRPIHKDSACRRGQVAFVKFLREVCGDGIGVMKLNCRFSGNGMNHV